MPPVPSVPAVLAAVLAAAAGLSACGKKATAPAPAATVADAASATTKPGPMRPPVDDRYRGEYTDMPAGGSGLPAGSVGAVDAIQMEATRGGPRGEPRVYEDAQEQAHLARGGTPKFMNAQFRYYLADLRLVPAAESGCARPLLALKLAVENLHGTPTNAIHGRFTFAQTSGLEGDGHKLTDVVASYGADIVGPFSNRQGGITYATAYLDAGSPNVDAIKWDQVAAIPPGRRKVWFSPEAFFYPNGEQYTKQVGQGPASRTPSGCGGLGAPAK